MADNNKNTSIQQFIPTTFEQIDAIAKRLAQSDLLPKALKGKPADVAIVIMTGLEFGIGVMTAIRGINVACGCFSHDASEVHNAWLLVLRDLPMLAAAALMLLFPPKPRHSAAVNS